MSLGYRPAFRSALARSLYERIQKEEEIRNYDKELWYRCDVDRLPTPLLRDTFFASSPDEDTDLFLEQCYAKSDWLFVQLFHALAKALLCWFMTHTSVNGLLGRGSMFVFSPKQLDSLLQPTGMCLRSSECLEEGHRGVREGSSRLTMLDIGAGDGEVTNVLASRFKDVHVTDMSPVMRRVLSKKGYKVLDTEKWWQEPNQYDLISCLNVLDRCESPLTLLSQMKSKLLPRTGVLLLALVLPISQYVETGNNHSANEQLPMTGMTVEAQLGQLVDKVLHPLGLELVRWTRLPYLCEGDIDQSFYWLDDYVLVLKVKEEVQ